MDATTHGCGAGRSKSHISAIATDLGFTATTSGPIGFSWGEKEKTKMHRDSCTALTGFSPLITSLYSGHSARLSPLGFLALLIYTSLRATFTVRTVQLYFQAH